MLYKKTPFRYAEVVQAQRKLTRKGVFMGTRAQSLAHTKWLCKYHIVFAPKYRRNFRNYVKVYEKYCEICANIKG